MKLPLCVQDMFTSLTSASKPHHMLSGAGVILGYSHFGMLAAARWVLQQTQTTLREAMENSPGYHLQIVGHSLGAGTAALLTTRYYYCPTQSQQTWRNCPPRKGAQLPTLTELDCQLIRHLSFAPCSGTGMFSLLYRNVVGSEVSITANHRCVIQHRLPLTDFLAKKCLTIVKSSSGV